MSTSSGSESLNPMRGTLHVAGPVFEHSSSEECPLAMSSDSYVAVISGAPAATTALRGGFSVILCDFVKKRQSELKEKFGFSRLHELRPRRGNAESGGAGSSGALGDKAKKCSK